MKNKYPRFIAPTIRLGLLVLALAVPAANAAFCSLRDPISAIQTLFDEDNQFRSVVTDVTHEDREQLKQLLPFTIHQSEVAKHTLYVVYNGETPQGFLQARSEWAKWGLVEIAWAMNLDRSVKGFYFQRCRSPQCNDSVVASISNALKGKNFSELKGLLSDDGNALSATGEAAFPIAPNLALLTLHSALKTLAITDISWQHEIQNITQRD